MPEPRPISMAALTLVAILGPMLAAPAHADKPSWAGEGKSHKHENKDKHSGKTRVGDEQAGSPDRERQTPQRRPSDLGFDERDRLVIHDYYSGAFRSGKCPPGLAKKHNGCQPPGQARKWSRGRPLPRDVVIYDLPRAVLVRLGPPPAGHRYVRVASDILLIAVGSAMVVDALEDLGRM